MKRVLHIVRVAGNVWMMESTAAQRHPDAIEIVDTVVSIDYKTRLATSKSGVVYKIYIDNSVSVAHNC
jgi:hypothetical protein